MEAQNRDEVVREYLRKKEIKQKRVTLFHMLQYPRHLFVHIGGPAITYADPLLEVKLFLVSVNRIYLNLI